LSNSKSSTKETSSPIVGESSTVTVPSSPTVCSARATTRPMASSSLAEIAATLA
jgi:hypothetical protein